MRGVELHEGTPREAPDAGFSLVELLVATLILLAVSGAVLGFLAPATTAFETQPELSDVQQRLRVTVSTLQKHIAMAGAGAHAGVAAGSLGDYVAPVMPYRWGDAGADSPGTFRADTITVLYVPQTPAETAVVRTVSAAGPDTVLETRVDCGGSRHDDRCGFDEGMRVLVFEPRGNWDVGVAAHVSSNALQLTRVDPFSSEYSSGHAVATELASHTYYLHADVRSRTFQLMHYDGVRTDMPVVDDVVRLEFRYWGDPLPPQLLSPGAVESAPKTTYGPRPPELGMPSGLPWPDGENCVFAVVDGAHVARLGVLHGGGGLAELPASLFNDGPWCPHGASALRYDADLLRVRRIGVRLRVQAGAASFRGPASSLFLHGGTGRPSRYVPDQEIALAIAPDNLHVRR